MQIPHATPLDRRANAVAGCQELQDWELETIKKTVLCYAKTQYWSNARRFVQCEANGVFDRYENIRDITFAKYNEEYKNSLEKRPRDKDAIKSTQRCFARLNTLYKLEHALLNWEKMREFTCKLRVNNDKPNNEFTDEMSSVTDKLVFYKIHGYDVLQQTSPDEISEWVRDLKRPGADSGDMDIVEIINTKAKNELGYTAEILQRDIDEREAMWVGEHRGGIIDNRNIELYHDMVAQRLNEINEREAQLAEAAAERQRLENMEERRRQGREKQAENDAAVARWHQMHNRDGGNSRRLLDISSELHPALAAPDSTLTSASIATVAVILGFVAYKASQFLRSLKSNEDSEESDSDVGNP